MLQACNCIVDPECRQNLPGCPDTQLSLLLPRFMLQPLAVPADTRGALRQAAVRRILAAGGAGLDPLRDAALAHLVTQVPMFLSHILRYRGAAVMHACCSIFRSICSLSLIAGLAVILAMMHSWRVFARCQTCKSLKLTLPLTLLVFLPRGRARTQQPPRCFRTCWRTLIGAARTISRCPGSTRCLPHGRAQQ